MSGDESSQRRTMGFPSFFANYRLAIALVFTALAAGLVGLFFKHLLEFVESTVYGSSPTFIEAVKRSPAWVRVVAVISAGIIGALSWSAIYRWGEKLVSIPAAINGAKFPVVTTFFHTVTQVVIVGLGASIGRELAPRELSSAISAWLCDRLKITPSDRKVIVACAAGAGLAAVYSVPLSGAIFTLEILLVSLNPRAISFALFTSSSAVLISSGWNRPTPFYQVVHLEPSLSLMLWAVVCGPLLGLSGIAFRLLVDRAEQLRPTNWHVLISMPLVFTLVAFVAWKVPEIMGNGQAAAQAAFDATTFRDFLPLLTIILLKGCATLMTISSGAWGGTLTPGLAVGAGLGALTGILWSSLWPGASVAACTFIGAAAFLGVSMHAPLTSIMLLLEFTHQGTQILVPLLTASALASLTSYAYEKRGIGRSHLS